MERRLSSCSEPWNCNRRIEAAAEGFHIKLEINFNNWFLKNLSDTEAPYQMLTPENESADEMLASVLAFSMVEEWMNKSELYLRRRDIFQNEHWFSNSLPKNSLHLSLINMYGVYLKHLQVVLLLFTLQYFSYSVGNIVFDNYCRMMINKPDSIKPFLFMTGKSTI